MCNVWKEKVNVSKELSLEELKKLVNEIADWGN
jgi:hypothetical protein